MNHNLISKIYKKAPEAHLNQSLKKAIEISDRIFSGNSQDNDMNYYINLIKQQDGVFYRLIKYFNPSNRMGYCKAIFDYCEMSQDWRVVGMWLKEEIEQLETEIVKNNDRNTAWLYFAYGRYLEETGKFNQSFAFHQKGIEASQKHHDLLNLALNQLGIGITLQRFTNTKDIEQAADYLIQAVEFFKYNNAYQQANSLMNLGSCYDRLNKIDKAIKFYQECIDILKKINNQFDLSRAYYSLGIAYLNCNQLQEAETAFTEGKFYCDQSENIYFLSHIYYGLGWLEYCKNNFAISQKFLEQSIRTFNKYKEDYCSVHQASFYESEGNIYLLASASYCKTLPIAQEKVNYYLNKAELAYQELEHPEKKLAQVLANRARLYEYIEQWETAIDLFYKLFFKGKELKQINIMSDASLHLFRIYLQKKSSIWAWLMLLTKLNLLGCWSLLFGFLQRQKRSQKIVQYLTNQSTRLCSLKKV